MEALMPPAWEPLQRRSWTGAFRTALVLPGAGDRSVESRTQCAEVTVGTVPLKFIYIVEQWDVGPESCERSE